VLCFARQDARIAAQPPCHSNRFRPASLPFLVVRTSEASAGSEELRSSGGAAREPRPAIRPSNDRLA